MVPHILHLEQNILIALRPQTRDKPGSPAGSSAELAWAAACLSSRLAEEVLQQRSITSKSPGIQLSSWVLPKGCTRESFSLLGRVMASFGVRACQMSCREGSVQQIVQLLDGGLLGSCPHHPAKHHWPSSITQGQRVCLI